MQTSSKGDEGNDPNLAFAINSNTASFCTSKKEMVYYSNRIFKMQSNFCQFLFLTFLILQLHPLFLRTLPNKCTMSSTTKDTSESIDKCDHLTTVDVIDKIQFDGKYNCA